MESPSQKSRTQLDHWRPLPGRSRRLQSRSAESFNRRIKSINQSEVDLFQMKRPIFLRLRIRWSDQQSQRLSHVAFPSTSGRVRHQLGGRNAGLRYNRNWCGGGTCSRLGLRCRNRCRRQRLRSDRRYTRRPDERCSSSASNFGQSLRCLFAAFELITIECQTWK